MTRHRGMVLLLVFLGTGSATPRVVRLETGEGPALVYTPPTKLACAYGGWCQRKKKPQAQALAAGGLFR